MQPLNAEALGSLKLLTSSGCSVHHCEEYRLLKLKFSPVHYDFKDHGIFSVLIHAAGPRMHTVCDFLHEGQVPVFEFC